PGLYHTSLDRLAPVPVPLPSTSAYASAVYVDHHNRVWLAADESVCWADGEALAANQKDSWHCTRCRECRQVDAFHEMPSGAIWVATYQSGLMSFDTRSWRLLSGSLRFPTRNIGNLVASRRGGVWIVTLGSLIRVRERQDLPDGFEVLESLSAKQ